eukprot:Rmarinus@m.1565
MVLVATFGDEGRKVAIASDHGNITVFDTESKHLISTWKCSCVVYLSFHVEGILLYACTTSPPAIVCWNTETRKEEFCIPAEGSMVSCSLEAHVIAVSQGYKVRIFDTQRPGVLPDFVRSVLYEAMRLFVSPCMRGAVSLRCRLPRYFNLPGRISGETSRPFTVACFSPEGRWFIYGAQTLYAWDVWQAEDRLTGLVGHSADVRVVAFGFDDELIASGSDDCTVRVWNIAFSVCKSVLHGHQAPITGVGFSGKTVVSCDSCGTARMWDVGDSTCIRVWNFSSLCPIIGMSCHRTDPVVVFLVGGGTGLVAQPLSNDEVAPCESLFLP